MKAEMISEAGEIAIGLLVLAGALIGALSAFGLVRLPDVYLRSHAATKSATLGVLFILAGAFLYFAFYLVASAVEGFVLHSPPHCVKDTIKVTARKRERPYESSENGNRTVQSIYSEQ